MAAYETEDGEPRYGRRLDPEELAAHLRERGIRPPSDAGAPAQEPGAAASSRVTAPDAAFRRRSGVRSAASGGPRTAGAPVLKAPHRWRHLGIGLMLMLVVAPLALVVGVLSVVEGPLTQGAQLGADGAVYLKAGTTTGLYGTSATATSGCTVSGPDGVEVVLATPEAGVPYVTFTAGSTGVHTVSCPAGTSGLVAGPTMNLDRVPVAALLIVSAGATGVAGLVITLVGALRARR
ncbi:hypothetical protein [Actinomyces sp.]|uniref:hypothetical protein n=1 Tax=Actinomyces sp. TaxID=29317 RepID=UPI0026DA7BC8|nr:hypothetical protein [Actinomyces sp.]MDO4901883.1 hypothetical protein [Actinomyces sp.]